jgi:hypothetical protein
MMDTDSLPLPSDADYGQLLGLLLEHALRHGLYALVDGLAGQLEEGSSYLGPEQKQLLYLRCGLTFLLSSGPLPEILNTSFTSTFQVHGYKQCCGSGSGIRCLFNPWIRDG